jgi:carbon monoxide dehydrogenase subunit G
VVQLSGTHEFGAERELVWETFLDPEVLARIMPGCERLERVGDHEYEGVMKIRVGPVQGAFQGTVQLSDLQPPHSYHMLVNGRGPAGIVRGEGDVRLESTPSGTTMHYEGNAQISGRIATVGQRLMESSAQAIARQSLDNLDRQIQARQQPATSVEAPLGEAGARAAVAPVSAPPAPGQTEFALNVARDVVTDLIPDSRQRWLLGGGVIALVLAALLNWFANLVARRVVRQLRQERR